MNKENCALKLVDEIILYYDARSKEHQIRGGVVALAEVISLLPVARQIPTTFRGIFLFFPQYFEVCTCLVHDFSWNPIGAPCFCGNPVGERRSRSRSSTRDVTDDNLDNET